ncbi:MAG TPA: hypoxanthine phosphoribosyltransferase [Ruminococcaceae bacterium]|nr:hypoxanthine phosphoribosyltransferase [Oscillospiraceae bacterium]
MHKNIESILISEDKLEKIVNSLAKQIEKDYNDKEFIMLGLLKGSIAFMADLMKHINLDFRIDFIVASSYGSGTESSGKVKITKDTQFDVRGKNILIVEDVVDSGNTLNFVCNYLMTRGAADVKVVTLCDKPSRRKVPFEPDYVGQVIPDEFIVGYGLDYNELYRNLPYIGVLKRSVYE